MSTTIAEVTARLWHGLLAYAVKFGVVGLIGLVIDVALFNALRLGGSRIIQDRRGQGVAFLDEVNRELKT